MAKRNNSILHQKKNIKDPAGAPPNIILQKIDVRKWVRTEQDIPKWRAAIRSFEALNPRRRLLYNLYADVELDGHVQSVTSKRKDAVTRAKWQFLDKDGKDVDEIKELIDSLGFDELLHEIIASKFWGYTICEPRFWKGIDDRWEMSAGLLPRLHYMPEKGIVTYDSVGEEGINIREGIYLKTVMEVGDVKDMGLYVIAAAYQILKRGGVGDYAAFIQTFGNPIIDAMWDGVNTSQKEQLQAALDGIGAGGNIIRPDGTTIDIKENRTKDTSDAHGSFLKFLNNEISKALLGTTETTESSSSSGYAQSKTHADEDDDKHMTDITFVRKVLNSRFIRLLQAAGFDTRGGKFSVQEEDKKLTKKEHFEMISKAIKELGIPVDDDFIYELLNVPKPEDYDALKKMISERHVQAGNNDPEPPTQKKKPKGKEKKATPYKKEEAVELKWYQKLFPGFFVGAPQDGAAPMSCSHTHIRLADSDHIDDDAFIRRIYDARGKAKFDAPLFYHTASLLNKAFKNGWDEGVEVHLSDNPSFTYDFNDPAYIAAFERSLYRFAGQKDLAIVQRLNQLFRQSSSFDEFHALAKKEVSIKNRDWLETEYTTANLTGRAASNYARLMANKTIFPFWEYTTIGDDKVRHSHIVLDGIVLKAGNKIWEKLFPPNGWNCRCHIVPRMAHEVESAKVKADEAKARAYLDSPIGKREISQGWGMNRFEKGEVFTDAQQYNSKFNNKMIKELNRLNAEDYGIESKVSGTPLPKIPTKLPDANNQLRDYQNRPIKISGSHKNAQLYAAMQATLEQPDEVWLNGKEMGQMVFIGYYKGRSLVTICNTNANGIQVKKYFFAEVLDTFRKGLLIMRQ